MLIFNITFNVESRISEQWVKWMKTNFIPLALAKCPKTFGLTELHKGYFPYLFNTKSNQQVKNVAYPSPEFYGDKYMQSKARDDFLKWHSQQNDKNFNFTRRIS